MARETTAIMGAGVVMVIFSILFWATDAFPYGDVSTTYGFGIALGLFLILGVSVARRLTDRHHL